MKKAILLITIISIFLLSCNESTKTTDDNTDDNQIVNIPDANFKAALIRDSLINTNGDDEIQVSEALATDIIDVSSKDITDLTGIEVFPNLISLICYDNQLITLDVSNNSALAFLYCYDNQLTTLDVSNNTALSNLHCYENQLTTLDVSNHFVLGELYCYDNQLTILDVSNNSALANLSCSFNNLTTLDVSSNTALYKLYCNNNQLTTLYVSNNAALYKLYCHDNQLTTLDISNNAALHNLSCHDNFNLICIEVDNATWATTQWGEKIDSHAFFSNDCK
jgi:hypothetical protein